MQFSKQEYWSEGHSLLQGIFLTQGLNPGVHALQADSLPSESPGKPQLNRLMSGRIIPAILGKEGFPGIGPPPTFWLVMASLGTVITVVGMLFRC